MKNGNFSLFAGGSKFLLLVFLRKQFFVFSSQIRLLYHRFNDKLLSHITEGRKFAADSKGPFPYYFINDYLALFLSMLTNLPMYCHHVGVKQVR